MIQFIRNEQSGAIYNSSSRIDDTVLFAYSHASFLLLSLVFRIHSLFSILVLFVLCLLLFFSSRYQFLVNGNSKDKRHRRQINPPFGYPGEGWFWGSNIKSFKPFVFCLHLRAQFESRLSSQFLSIL